MTSIGFDKPRPDGAVTIHDVAALAGVSLVTVSRALNSPEQLSAKTLARVLAAVEQMGYVPNLSAGSLRSSRTRLIAALMPTLQGHFAAMFEALTNRFAMQGYQVVMGKIGYSVEQEADMLRTIFGRRPDGIILTGVSHSPEARRLLAVAGIPIVETWDVTPEPIDMLVSFSHEETSTQVCRYLFDKGRRRIGVISGDDPRSLRRNKAFSRTAQDLGLVPPVIYTVLAPTTHASGRAALSALLAGHSELDAAYCSSDMLAMGVLTEARVRGISVPRQLAVVGSGDLDFAATLAPSLTTVRIDGGLLGHTAAEFIIDRLEGKNRADKTMTLSLPIIERESA
jgi:LacI family gluconate utilization system Gnt-I transcriptional repressor